MPPFMSVKPASTSFIKSALLSFSSSRTSLILARSSRLSFANLSFSAASLSKPFSLNRSASSLVRSSSCTASQKASIASTFSEASFVLFSSSSSLNTYCMVPCSCRSSSICLLPLLPVFLRRLSSSSAASLPAGFFLPVLTAFSFGSAISVSGSGASLASAVLCPVSSLAARLSATASVDSGFFTKRITSS